MAIVLEKLAASPFTVLGVSPRASQDAVLSAAEDRVFDGVDADVLESARNALTIPRERIAAELRYYPDISPARLDEIVEKLRAGGGVDEIKKAVETLPALARLNLAVDLLRSEGPNYLPVFCDAVADFDPQFARQAIDETRSVSKFRRVAKDEWRDAIRDYKDDLAQDLYLSLTTTNDPASRLIDLLESDSWLHNEWFSSVLDGAIDRYDRWSEPKLSKIQSSLSRHIDLASTGSLNVAITGIEKDLSEWDLVNQPVQMRDESRGLDEPKSRKVFEQVRDLALKLANEDGRYREAKRISEALRKTFPELPSVLVRLEEDLETLDDLISQREAQKILQPLMSIVAQTKADLLTTARWVNSGHFSSNGHGDVGALYDAHFSAVAHAKDNDVGDLPWRLTRSVALELSNEASEPRAAKIILDVIKDGAPASILSLIREDLSVLEVLILQQGLSSAIQSENWDRALETATQLVAADPENKDDWLKLQGRLKSKISSRNRSRWFWGILGLGIAATAFSEWVQDQSFESSAYDDFEYEDPQSSAGQYEDFEPSDNLEPSEADSAPDDQLAGLSSLSVRMPSTGASYATLSRSELRYCMFEERRISYLDPRVSPAVYQQFNLRIDDFNSRCENRRFYLNDQSVVREEIAQYGTELDAEAQRIHDEWRSQNSLPQSGSPAIVGSQGSGLTPTDDNYAGPSRLPDAVYEEPSSPDGSIVQDGNDDPLAPLEQGDQFDYEY